METKDEIYLFSDKDKKNASNMMKQYFLLKEKYKDVVLFYRLGDFYELFDSDAVLCSKILDLTLTSKNCSLDNKVAMCGVPAKACDIYLKKLLSLGYKVGICEQLTEPTENSRELVERDVVRIVTPGTIMEDEILEQKKNNYIACVYYNKDYSIAFTDISTGEFYITTETTLQAVNDFLVMINPSEIICNDEMKLESLNLSAVKYSNIPAFNCLDGTDFNLKNSEELFVKQFKTQNYKVFEITNKNQIICIGALFSYLFKTQKRALNHINNIKYYYSKDYMYLDANTRKHLELVANKEGKKKGTILWLLDRTSTSMGGRMLRNFIEQPLFNQQQINNRLDSVEELNQNLAVRDDLTQLLKSVCDLERLSAKISYNSINPRECVAIKNSLKILPEIKEKLSKFNSKLLSNIFKQIDDFSEICDLLDRAFKDKVEVVNFKDGDYIKEGFDAEFDENKRLSTHVGESINDLLETERELTGIKGLKVEYSRVFGYLFEVTNSQKDLVPYRYIRKQTLTNAERYYTQELKELENKILNSKEKALKREIDLFVGIRERLNFEVPKLQNTSKLLALLDALISLSIVSIENDYVKPKINADINHIKIEHGRHPIIEKLLKKGEFIDNDTLLDTEENRTMIITGPNMAGKSTYMRQVALITLLAHIGSFVPAQSAEISLTDRIFTRIGASDDLLYGQSTFMVEMTEVANILANATDKSLILL
ncbi:MAG: DNA mismatch repair protein MutS, partial [Christensenellales bacterium]